MQEIKRYELEIKEGSRSGSISLSVVREDGRVTYAIEVFDNDITEPNLVKLDGLNRRQMEAVNSLLYAAISG